MAGLTTQAQNNVLEQATAVRPFVGESIALAPIAVRTGKYHIVGIMTRGKFSTGNRNSMIEMIDIRSILALLKCAKAIIAGILLGSQLGLNVLHRQRSLDVSLPYMPFLLSNALPSKVLFAVTLIVLFLPIIDFFTMGGAIEHRICKHLFSVFLIIPFLVFSMSISIDFILLISTYLTTRIKSTSRMSMEELRSCGKPLQAFGALLLRKINRKHDLNCLSFSVPYFFCCQSGKATTFSQRRATSQIGNTSKYTFFFAA